MMIIRIIKSCTLLVTIFTSTETLAEFSANISLTSNYVSNGFTQTDDKPAIQGGIGYAGSNGFYIGSWGSTLQHGLEIDIYAGYAKVFKNIKYDIGYQTYNYTDNAYTVTPKEIYMGLMYRNTSLYYSTDHNALYGYYYINLRTNIDINNLAILKLHYGLIKYETSPVDYYDYSITISKYIKEVELSLTYTDQEFSHDEKVFFTIKKYFSL